MSWAALLVIGMDMMQPTTPPKPGSGPIPAVKTCQVGFLPNEQKIAVITTGAEVTAEILRLPDRTRVFSGSGSAPRLDPDSGDTVSHVDFTSLQEPGRYVVSVPGLGESAPFEIGPNVFAKPFRLAIRSFTGQRSGIDVSLAPDYPEYRFPAGQTELAKYHPSSGKTGTRDVRGGWYDAGDYGKYMVNSGITTGTLLLAFERNAAKLARIKLDIPESGKSKLPDFLSEIKWNLDWMLKMQDEDGGAWHKATTAQFSGFVMPAEDRADLLIIGTGKAPYKNTTATANLAAVAAIAARVFRPFDPGYADRCLVAAKKAFEWCQKFPRELYEQQPEGIGTGGYGDGQPDDERLWAATELYRATGESGYHEAFLELAQRWPDMFGEGPVPSWQDVRPLALLGYALIKDRPVDREFQNRLRQDLEQSADAVVQRIRQNGYLMPLRSSDYVWGSNGGVANYAVVLQMANSILPKESYRQAALDCLHHLFGRNLWGTSYVTHVGTKWAKNPHHRPSGADNVQEPWPGLLVGGPNADNGQKPPARQWFDVTESYRTNENAINWNAPLVFALAEYLGTAP